MASERFERPDARTPGEHSPRRDADSGQKAPRDARDHRGEHGDPTGEDADRMPLGGDEPGAGL